jgi:hypothetical protein
MLKWLIVAGVEWERSVFSTKQQFLKLCASRIPRRFFHISLIWHHLYYSSMPAYNTGNYYGGSVYKLNMKAPSSAMSPSINKWSKSSTNFGHVWASSRPSHYKTKSYISSSQIIICFTLYLKHYLMLKSIKNSYSISGTRGSKQRLMIESFKSSVASVSFHIMACL